jgi:tetratricopeptide (TPR) repeat protein
MNWNKESEALDLSNLGLMYHIKGNKEKALDYLNQALAIYKQIGAKKEIAQTQRDIKMLKGK